MENKELFLKKDKRESVFDTRTEEEKVEVSEKSKQIISLSPDFKQNADQAGNNAQEILKKNEEDIQKAELDEKLNLEGAKYTEQQALKKKDEEGDRNFRRIKEGGDAAELIAEEKHAFREKMKSLKLHRQLKVNNTIKKKKGKESYRSNSLHVIMQRMDELQNKLEEKLADPQQVGAGNKSLLEQQMEGIGNLMRNIILMCDEYDKSHKPWFWQSGAKARKRMLRQMAEQLKEESRMLEHHVDEYKRDFANGEVQGSISWVDLLGDVRREQIISGVNGKEVEKGGAGTSDLYIVKEGDKKRFIKREERVLEYDAGSAFEERKKQILAMIRLKQSIKGGTQEEQEKRKAEIAKLKKEGTILLEFKQLLNIEDPGIFLGQDGTRRLYDKMVKIETNKNGYRHLMEYTDKKYSRIGLSGRLSALFGKYNEIVKEYGDFAKKYEELHIKEVQLRGEIEIIDPYVAELEDEEEKKERLKDKANYQKELEEEVLKKKAICVEKLDERDEKLAVVKEGLKEVTDALNGFFKIFNTAAIATQEVKIEPGESLSKRNVATYRMAKLLNLEHLLAKAEMKDLEVDGEKLRGMEMEQVEGSHHTKLAKDIFREPGTKDYSLRYSAKAMRDLSSLQLFDVICGQVDRNAGNYMSKAIRDDKKKVAYLDEVKGIDNDMSFGKLTYKQIVKSQKRMRLFSPEDHDGNMRLYGLDGELADSILALTPQIVKYTLVDLLSPKEMDALVDRLKGVQKLLRRQKELDRKQTDAGKRKLIYSGIEKENGKADDSQARKQWEKIRDQFEREVRQDKTKVENKSYFSNVWAKSYYRDNGYGELDLAFRR